MAQADTASIPQACSVQHAAEAIVALINSSPRSPRQEEIEAIVTKVLPSGTVPATPLLTKIRETAARLDEAFDVQGKVEPGDPVEEAAQARIDQLQGDLEDLEGQISSPPRSFADLFAWAEIARAGADIRKDGTMAETSYRDVFLRPAARLIEAVLQMGTRGCVPTPSQAIVVESWGAEPLARLPGISPQHLKYRELLVEARTYDEPDEHEGEDDETAFAALEERITALEKEIWAKPAVSLADVLLRGEIALHNENGILESVDLGTYYDDRANAQLIRAVVDVLGGLYRV